MKKLTHFIKKDRNDYTEQIGVSSCKLGRKFTHICPPMPSSSQFFISLESAAQIVLAPSPSLLLHYPSHFSPARTAQPSGWRQPPYIWLLPQRLRRLVRVSRPHVRPLSWVPATNLAVGGLLNTGCLARWLPSPALLAAGDLPSGRPAVIAPRL